MRRLAAVIGIAATCGAVGCAIGIIAYTLVLRYFFREVLSSGDLVAVVAWTALFDGALLSVVHVPLAFYIRKLRMAAPPTIAFAVAPIVAIIPTALIAMSLSSWQFSSLLRSETLLFYVAFLGSSLFVLPTLVVMLPPRRTITN